MTRVKFRKHAPKLGLKIGTAHLSDMAPREHATGSVGWKHNEKITIRVGDEYVRCQVNVAVTVIKSKAMPEDQAQAKGGAP